MQCVISIGNVQILIFSFQKKIALSSVDKKIRVDAERAKDFERRISFRDRRLVN